MDKLEDIVKEALDVFAGIDDAVELEQVKARFLGKSGALTELQKGLGRVPAAERPAMGVRFNAAKEQLEAARIELEQAQRKGNLQKSAEIQYGKLPELEKKLLNPRSVVPGFVA